MSSYPEWQIGPFEKCHAVNPIMGPEPSTRFYCPVREELVDWEAKDVFNPCAVTRHGRVYLLYRAEDHVGRYKGTSRIGLAVSEDGITFERHSCPVLYPDNDSFLCFEREGGVEDPRIVEDEDRTYYMTYNAYNGVISGKQCLATSRDLLHWTKHGLMAGLDGERQGGVGFKAGKIVSRLVDDRLVATRINGKYWMYWGVEQLRVAVSDNLIHWERVLDEDGRDLVVMGPRPEERYSATDNLAVEGGAAAILTEHGIVVMYNGISNPLPEQERVPTPEGPPFGNVWAGVQALFDANDPTRMLDRADEPFIKPDQPYELEGQIGKVTFIEGLVFHRGQWLIYYGTADSYIAVAAASPKPGERVDVSGLSAPAGAGAAVTL
ncbi:glycoside hydrolase family 130 protein [Mucisphaera calidilacus]|uniref:glycoside hydrolase family 130 protein n=1 Tax=Mucisphaera calidilacus TaxID=2527982 RepID=UPI001F1BB507|nr:glycoside hydrolase family 130 protein [Mucisphaera calidilacus]